MFEKIRRLGTETAIYGVSTIVGRFLTFLLTPFYVNVLPSTDVGIVATAYSYIAFLNVMFGYGMESAFMKYRSTLEIGDARQNFSIPFFSLGGTSVILVAVMMWQQDLLGGLAGDTAAYSRLVPLIALILGLDALSVIPFASLRLARKAARYSVIRLLSIVTNVALNLFFLLQKGAGLDGIFYSNIISSGLTLVLLLPTIIRNASLEWNGSLYKALLRFGLPYVPASIAMMMIQVIDRPIMLALTDEATVGIYQANYRLGIFMMLVVSMFDAAWRPFFLAHEKDPGAKELFARVMTYCVLLMSGVFLLVSFFLEDAVKVPVFWGHSILPAEYWHGLPLVPVVMLGYMFLGVTNNLIAGVYIEKKTEVLPPITFVAAGINVAGNLLLIPLMGMMGAAVATLLSYAVMALGVYGAVRRFYPVAYEVERLAKIILGGGVVFFLFLAVKPEEMQIAWKVLLLLLFGVFMYVMKFFEAAELQGIVRIFRRRGPRASGPHVDGFSPLE